MAPVDYSRFSFADMSAVLERNKAVNCILIGSTGSGKTTLLRHINQELANNGVVFDLVFALTTMISDDANLYDIVPMNHCIVVKGGKAGKESIIKFLEDLKDSLSESGLLSEDVRVLVIGDDLHINTHAFKDFQHFSRHLHVSCMLLVQDITHIAKEVRTGVPTFLFMTSGLKITGRAAYQDYPELDKIYSNSDLKQFVSKRGNVIVLKSNIESLTDEDEQIFTLRFSYDKETSAPIVFRSYSHATQLFKDAMARYIAASPVTAVLGH